MNFHIKLIFVEEKFINVGYNVLNVNIIVPNNMGIPACIIAIMETLKIHIFQFQI